MIARGQHLLMADADGATRTSDLARLEEALQQLNDPGWSVHCLTPYGIPCKVLASLNAKLLQCCDFAWWYAVFCQRSLLSWGSSDAAGQLSTVVLCVF